MATQINNHSRRKNALIQYNLENTCGRNDEVEKSLFESHSYDNYFMKDSSMDGKTNG